MTALKRLFGFERVSLALALCSVAAFSWLVFSNPLPGGPSVPRFSVALPSAVAKPLELVDLHREGRSSIVDYKSGQAQAFTVDHLKDTFSRIGYHFDSKSPETVQVPRFYLASLPHDMAAIREAGKRKVLFFKTILPLVLKANEEVLGHRERLWRLHYQAKMSERITAIDQLWLNDLAEDYGVRLAGRDLPTALTVLLDRVDVVPTSLALAQAAEESGWGTSRFAKEGNALFGQWTYKAESGITPKDRDAGASHAIKAFDNLGDAVRAYMRNLNTHRAYRKLRTLRADARRRGEAISGYKLAAGLEKYSARGEHYISSLRAIIRANDLEPLDDAILAQRGHNTEI